jgi:hypothetical protein
MVSKCALRGCTARCSLAQCVLAEQMYHYVWDAKSLLGCRYTVDSAQWFPVETIYVQAKQKGRNVSRAFWQICSIPVRGGRLHPTLPTILKGPLIVPVQRYLQPIGFSAMFTFQLQIFEHLEAMKKFEN